MKEEDIRAQAAKEEEDIRARAVDVARKDLVYFKRQHSRARSLHFGSQVMAIGFNAAVPILVLFGCPNGGAVFAALAGIAVALAATFGWRDTWVRAAGMNVQVEDDIRDFELGVAPYKKGDPESIGKFRGQMRALRNSEFSEWKKNIEPRPEGG